MAVFAVGGFVEVGTHWIAEVEAEGVGPEGGVDDFDVVFADLLRVVAVVGEETFLQGIVHGVDGGLAGFVAVHGVDVLLLYEKENEKKGGKNADDDYFENSKAFFSIHGIYYSIFVLLWMYGYRTYGFLCATRGFGADYGAGVLSW